ncbi:MAG: threonine/serine exporter ThrE family protein [Candidatus Cryptobacteroides sp.]
MRTKLRKMVKPGSEEVLKFASEAGRVLLENGAEISRVEETMERIATHYGESGENFFVLSNGIFTTGKSYANAEFIPIKGASLDKVVEVNQLSRDIALQDLSLDEARLRLAAIRNKKPKPAWELYLGAAFGCAGFCAIFGGSLLDCGASLVAAVILNCFVMKIGTPYLSKTLGNICAGFIGTLICIFFQMAGFGDSLGNMIVGTLILLIPGVAFTNGLRDMANEDYLAGITRLLDALMMFLSIAIGVCFAFIAHSWIAGGVIHLTGTVTDTITAAIPVQMIAAFIGTASFAVLFGAPRRHYATAGIVGMLGWLTFLVIFRYTSAGAFASTFIASTVVAFLSRFAAVRLKCPSTVFLICGEFPMIPGGGVFWSAYYIASEQFPLALTSGLQAVKITLAIVLGIIIAANVFNRRK